MAGITTSVTEAVLTQPTFGDRPSKQIYRVISMGGCATHESARLAAKDSIIHAYHFWRRPTIALVAPRAKYHPIPGHYSAEFARYWHDDFNKSHLDNLLEMDGNVLLFDVLRDIWTGVIRKNNTYVMDPVEGLHFVADVPFDQIPGEADAQLRGGDQVYNYKHEDFLDLWKEHIDTFVEIASGKFEHLILHKHYLATHRVTSGKKLVVGKFANIDSDDFSEVNNLLEEMYSYLSTYENVRVNTISRSLMLTGRHVPLFGPFPTHFVPEANALFAENLRSYLLGKRYIQGNKFIATSLERIRYHEDLIEEADGLRASLAHVVGERDAERAEVGNLRSEGERLNLQLEQASADRGHADATLAHVMSERDAIRADVERLAAERGHYDAVLAQITSERDASRAEIERLAAERGHYDAVLAQITSERDASRAEIERLAAERGHYDAVLAQITSERDASRAEIERLGAERGHVDALLAQATSDRDATHIELGRLADEKSHAEVMLVEAARERDEARGEIERLAAERSHFETALARTSGERDALRSETERLRAERGHLETALAQASSERNAASEEVRRLVAERFTTQRRSWRPTFLRSVAF